jgi:hypothetical protein
MGHRLQNTSEQQHLFIIFSVSWSALAEINNK